MAESMTLERKADVKNGIARMIFTVIAILVEIVFILNIAFHWVDIAWVSYLFRGVAILVVLGLYGKNMSPSFKMPWIMLIMGFPVLGLMLYLLIGLNVKVLQMRGRYAEIDKLLLPLLPDGSAQEERLRKKDPYGAQLAHYLGCFAQYPLYGDTAVTYYDDGLKGLEAQLVDLKRAERFIFMEYHAIENAESFHRIRDVLVDRVKAGVEVRVFYDDMGSIGFINTDFVKEMKSYGIDCRVFNPFAPGLNLFLNNRDHRKITVIDGRVGFTGGYNLANEYFHVTKPFGFWKDTGIRLEGPAVDSLTVAFLENWNAVLAQGKNDKDIGKYLKQFPAAAAAPASTESFVQPYADSPMKDLHAGEDAYMAMAQAAGSYCWYVTPYLIITEETIHTLTLAAKRGVDVRIITPGIPDKKLIYQVTRSYYHALVREGVRIYEYTPGFCHAKMSVSDDRVAICGTINLDYRSLYHHFENGCVIYHDPTVLEIRRDFEEMFRVSKEVTEQYKTGRSSFLRLWQLILRLFAPLM